MKQTPARPGHPSFAAGSAASRTAAWCLALSALLATACGTEAPATPETRRDDIAEMLHGVPVSDPYRWLEDQQSAETRAWIAAQNQYTTRVLASAPPVTEIRARLEQLYRVDSVSAPVQRGGRYFFARRAADQDVAALYMRRAAGEPDEVLVDPANLSADGSVSVALVAVSIDGTRVAYSVRRGGEDEVEVHFLDVDALEPLPDVLEHGRYFNVSIDGSGGVFYDRQAEEGPRVFHHTFGHDQSEDRLVFGRGYGREEIITSRLSSNGRYLLVTVNHGAAATRSELYFRDTWTSDQIHTIVSDIDATFDAQIAGDTLFVLTDWEAPRRRLLAANLRRPTPDSWTEIVAQGAATIERFVAVGGRLLVHSLQDVQPRLRVYEPDGFPVREVALPGVGSLAGELGDGDWENDEIFYVFSSLARPPAVYRYRISDGAQDVWAEPPVPLDPDDFVIEQVRYTSADGTSVPMFVAHRTGIVPDGSRPTLLTGYGGFNVSVLPAFDRMAVVWMERGGVWAVAGLRGGGEFGKEWHAAGMLERKQNVFDDFVAGAGWLISSGYTNPRHLAIMGGSNGGLLVGAALTQRPDLFAAVLCAYPLLDMLRYHRFLVASYWVPEYGSADDPDQFRYLYAYSPYHRVAAGVAYPAVMLVTGDGDTRVAPLHARKMTALLQAATGSSNPIVLRYHAEAGHSGDRPASATIDELTEELRFLLWRTR